MRLAVSRFGLFCAVMLGSCALAHATSNLGSTTEPKYPQIASSASLTVPPILEEKLQRPPTFTHASYFNVGLFSAVGMIGAAYVYSPSEPTELEFGAGLGFSGVQLSLMPKLALGSKHHRVLLGVGPSLGIADGVSYTTAWVNGDVGYEYRATSGFSIALSVGFTAELAGCWGPIAATRKANSEA